MPSISASSAPGAMSLSADCRTMNRSNASHASDASTRLIRSLSSVAPGLSLSLMRRNLFGARGRVPGFVQAELAAVGHLDRCDESPAFVADRTAEFDALA